MKMDNLGGYHHLRKHPYTPPKTSMTMKKTTRNEDVFPIWKLWLSFFMQVFRGVSWHVTFHWQDASWKMKVLAWGASRWPKMCSCHPGGDWNSSIWELMEGLYTPPAVTMSPPVWWWFQRFFIFTPIWGRFWFWLIFFNGLKPPTSPVWWFPKMSFVANFQTGGRCFFPGKYTTLNERD